MSKQETYKDSFVLVNKLGIIDENEFLQAEGGITSGVISDILFTKKIYGNLDFKHLQKLHKEIFDDIYDWAGEMRVENIAKGFQFTVVPLLPTYAEDIFTRLKKANYFQGIEREKQIIKIADLYGELNCLHPFREGNGRTNKTFIQLVAGINGFLFDFDMIPKQEWNKISYESSLGNEEGMRECLKKITVSLSNNQCNHFRRMCHLEPIDKMTNTSTLTFDVYDFVKDKKDKSEFLNTAFFYNKQKFQILDIEKAKGKAQADAIIQNCDTQEIFVEKNFAGSNPFKLKLNQKIDNILDYSRKSSSHME